MKAQISMEYLSLLAVFLVVLSISLASINSIKSFSENTIQNLNFKSQIKLIHSNIMSVCSLGSGNSRELDISIEFSIEYLENTLIFSNENNSESKSYNCYIEGPNSFKDKILVENINGKVFLS